MSYSLYVRWEGSVSFNELLNDCSLVSHAVHKNELQLAGVGVLANWVGYKDE